MTETRIARLRAALAVAAPGTAPAWAFDAGDAARRREFALGCCAGCREAPGGAPARAADAFAAMRADLAAQAGSEQAGEIR